MEDLKNNLTGGAGEGSLHQSVNQSSPPTNMTLPSSITLTKESFAVLKNMFTQVVIPVALFGCLWGVAKVVVAMSAQNGITLAINESMMTVLQLLFQSLLLTVITALVVARKDQRSFSAGVGWVLKNLVPISWITILVSLAVTGSLALFIVYAIAMAIWISFAEFAFYDKKIRGLGALAYSREVVSGFGLSIVWRMFILGCLLFLVSAALGTLLTVSAGGSFAGFLNLQPHNDVKTTTTVMISIFTVLSTMYILFVQVISIIFSVLLYEKIIAIKGAEVVERQYPRRILSMKIFVILGVVLIAGIISSVLFAQYRDTSKLYKETFPSSTTDFYQP